ncbi:MAG TPA: HD domain-containing protein [Nitrospirae bacterium]|nr:HD domain-containing protein [Nitrospirota bacterium]
MIVKAKIIAIIALVVLLTFSIVTLVILKVQEERLVNEKLADAEVINKLVESSIASAMKIGDSDEVQNIIMNIGKNRDIMDLRILSNNGEILKSKKQKEIGVFSRNFINFGRLNLEKSFIRDDSIYSYKVIKNRPECFGCHDRGSKVNGVIELVMDFGRYRSSIISFKRFLLFVNLAALITISITLSILLTRFILTPLEKLLRTIRDIEGGNLDARVDVDTADELGIIGSSFNRMITEVKNLYDKNLRKERELTKMRTELEHKRKLEELNSQLEFKIKELETANKAILTLSKEIKAKNVQLSGMVDRLKRINEVGRVLSSVIESDELMRLIIKTTTELIGAERGVIHLMRNDEDICSLKYTKGYGVEKAQDITIEFGGYLKKLLSHGRPMLMSNGNGSAKTAMAVPLKMKNQIVGAIFLENDPSGSQFTENELEILSTMANQAMVAIENAWLYEKVKTNYFATIQALVNALEANDRYTKGHSERVRILATELGRHIGLDYRELEILEHASILHDIGKIGIDSNILNKEGKLTTLEFSLVKAHPLIGEEILGPVDTLEGVKTTVIQHHERYDGSGYPYGLAGEEISLKARILSVVDTFDAMLTDRPYRRALPYSRAIEELKKGAGRQFDPFVVEAFIEMLNLKGQGFLIDVGYGLSLSLQN